MSKVIAIRLKDQKLLFDARTEKFTNFSVPNVLFNRPYRAGWSLPT
jgi:hypothetical protein